MILNKNGISAVILIVVLSACSSAKYSSDFKNDKKQVNSLTLYSPIIDIVYENKRGKFLDTVLNNAIQLSIEELAINLLSSKFEIERKEMPAISRELLDAIYYQIDNSPKQINGIKFDSIFNNNNPNPGNRFALLITLHGTINPDFIPHHNLRGGISPMGSMTVLIAPRSNPKSELRVMIIDTLSSEITFFDRINTSNHDPRINGEIEQLVRKILRRIYYM